KGFFDNIDHDVLLSTLREKIHDGRFIRLIGDLLRAGYLEDWSFRPTHSGTPQGGIVSPILSNIYPDRFGRFVPAALIPAHTRGMHRKKMTEYRRIEYLIRKARALGTVRRSKRCDNDSARCLPWTTRTRTTPGFVTSATPTTSSSGSREPRKRRCGSSPRSGTG